MALSEPTPEQLKIGRGEPSGRDGKWRVLDIPLSGDEALVFYSGGRSYRVWDEVDWAALPAYGLQVIRFDGGLWDGADEYRAFGVSKFGTFIDDDEYEAVVERARG